MKPLPKTLVVLTPAFPANESETSWVPTQQLFVRTLKAHFPGLHIIVLTFFYPYRAVSYEWHGVQVISLNGSGRRKFRRIFFWNAVWRLLKGLRRENDIIGLFSFWCGECALVASHFGRWHGIRHLCWICGQDARKMNKLVKFIRPRSEELIAMSDFLVKEFYKNHGIRPGYMISNAIDPDMFPPLASGKRDIDILGAGSLSRIKQYGLFAEVVGALRLFFPHMKSLICGEGDDRKELELYIKKNGLEDHITLAGEKPQKEVLRLMQRAKVFLHTSSYEGFGVVCLEALYAGAHVISFCKPLDRAIPNWHVVRDKEEMTKKAHEILQDPNIEYKPVLEHTMKRTVQAVMDLFANDRLREV